MTAERVQYLKVLPRPEGSLSISGGCQRYVFSREGHIFCHEVFFRMYLPLASDVHNKLFIDMLSFIVVVKIKKHLLTQGVYPQTDDGFR